MVDCAHGCVGRELRGDFFFFFQAEDGIRDLTVTGVQTCALPISVDVKRVGRELGVRYVLEGSVRRDGGRIRITALLIDAESGVHLWANRFDGSLRSEERRVGKECRSRWSPYH